MKGQRKKILAQLLGTTTFGANLIKLRMVQGLSQEALARKAEVSQRHLNRLEAGKAQPQPVVHKLAKALGVTVGELVD